MPFLIQMVKEGYEVEELSEQPALDPVNRWYFDAFFQLSRSRQYGFGSPQPIQIDQIKTFMDMKGIRGSEREQFLTYIQQLDQKFLEMKAEDND